MAARLGLVLALLSVPACVTQNIQFEPPLNYPPAIETSADDTPLIRLDGREMPVDGGTAETDIVLDVVVRDPNVTDELFYRVFRNYNPLDEFETPDMIATGEVLGDGESVDRPLRIVLDPNLFSSTARTCDRLELLVSSGFEASVRLREPATPGDLGAREWFVVNDGSVSIDACSPWFHQP